jgi:hypothetical protein
VVQALYPASDPGSAVPSGMTPGDLAEALPNPHA